MLKKCSEVITKLPFKPLLPQRALLQPLGYRFSNYERERLNQNAVEMDRSQPEKLRNKNFNISKPIPSKIGDQMPKENSSEETVFELSMQQKLYFLQAAGFLFLLNVLLRLSLDNKKHIDSYQRKL